MRYFVKLPSGREIPVDVMHLPSGKIEVSVEGRALDVEAFGAGASTHLLLDSRGFDLWLEGAPPDVGVVAGGRRFYAQVESERMRDLVSASKVRGPKGAGVLTSPMPGRVLKVLAREGDEVKAGAPLVVVEAMKMENELSVDRDGVVKKVHVAPGATVESGALLVEVG